MGMALVHRKWHSTGTTVGSRLAPVGPLCSLYGVLFVEMYGSPMQAPDFRLPEENRGPGGLEDWRTVGL